MITAVMKAEAVKLRSLASTWWFLATTAVVSLLLSALMINQPLDTERPGVTDAMAGPVVGQLLLTLLAARSATQEFRTGTIWAAHLAVPSWPRLLACKAAVAALLAAVVSAVLVVGAFAVALLTRADVNIMPSTTLEWRQVLMMPVASAICAFAGVAVGTLLKSGGAAITALLLWTLAGEPVMSYVVEWLTGVHIGAWLPSAALSFFVGQPAAPFPGGPYAAGAYVCCLSAALMLMATQLQGRREP